MKFAVDKVKDSGNDKIALIEEETLLVYTDLVVDFRGIPTMRQYAPTILDITHSLQQPNQSSGVTGGRPELIETIAKSWYCSWCRRYLYPKPIPNPAVAKSDGARHAEELDYLRSITGKTNKST